jgi:retinol dehydrogenase-14
VLVNNVGGYWATRHTTEGGLERTFAVNHLAPFLLTNLLLDRLTASAISRVVTVFSGAQAKGHLDFDGLQGVRSYRGQRAYNQTKLAQRAPAALRIEKCTPMIRTQFRCPVARVQLIR